LSEVRGTSGAYLATGRYRPLELEARP
jgi:hypothetical protein